MYMLLHIKKPSYTFVACFQNRVKPSAEMDLGLLQLLEAINYYQKEFHLGCCSSPKSARFCSVHP